MKRTYSTGEVTTIVGIARMTLLRWLRDGKITEPRRVGNGGVEARIWTDRDVERVRKFKQENYRKGRGRKPKPKR
jgi:predicted site-specific integrase-resolvase